MTSFLYFLALKQMPYNNKSMKAQLSPRNKQPLFNIERSLSFASSMFEGDVNSESKKFYSENNTPTSIYWKSNRLLVEEGSGFSVVGVEQLENQIQQHFLREHGSVINYQTTKLLNELENQGYQHDITINTWDQISNPEFANYFFDFLIQAATFDSYQTAQFKALLQKRKDWRKLCADLLISVSRKLYWQLAYIFYLCTNLLPKFQNEFKLNPSQLQQISKTYIKQNQILFKDKLYHLGKSSQMNSYLERIIYTILLLLNGFFVNKFFQEIDDQGCIRCSQNMLEKPKKLKLIGYKHRCNCHRPFEAQKPLKKKVKLTRNSI